MLCSRVNAMALKGLTDSEFIEYSDVENEYSDEFSIFNVCTSKLNVCQCVYMQDISLVSLIVRIIINQQDIHRILELKVNPRETFT